MKSALLYVYARAMGMAQLNQISGELMKGDFNPIHPTGRVFIIIFILYKKKIINK